MKTRIIDGYPNSDLLCAAIATQYASGNDNSAVLALRDLNFDPNTRFGYTRRQELEPDLERAWRLLLDADHVVVVTPIW